ncbi:ABC transporter permease [Rhodobacterales bacterium HKCCE2091]|nr:ABC transporter permease [Rhodobacterales bacterium HKCCE2091]
MFEARRRQSTFATMMSLCELTYHSAVRKVRQGHRNAMMALLMSILQAILFIAGFYLMFTLMGTKRIAIPGNYLVYLLTGIFLYLTHIKALGAVMGSEGPTSPMMQHGPMNTLVAILSSALQVLYVQTLSLLIILFLIHTLIEPVVFHRWAPAFGMYLVAWFSGIAIGLILLAMKPWMPEVTSIVKMVWSRANMIASGKMFVANMLPASMIALFAWNPLFHAIDQCRGYVFIDYVPHHSNWQYPLIVCAVLTMIGLIAEFFTRKNVSASWSAGR